MDILKILTRSTNLQKSLPAAKKSSARQVPSAGTPAGHLPLEKQPDFGAHVGSDALKRGTKRKRDETRDTSAIRELDGLDLLNEPETPPLKVRRAPGSKQALLSDSLDDGENTKITPRKFTKEECRKFFKQHKLKVILMRRDDSRSSKKRKNGMPQKIEASNDLFSRLHPQPLMSFGQLRTRYGISRRLAENLISQGYKIPTEVQLGSLPLLLGSDEDRGLSAIERTTGQGDANIDLLTVAPTGSGKTLAFLIPVLHGVLQERHVLKEEYHEEHRRNQPRAIIVAPTHELVDQIVNEGKKLAIGTGVKVSAMRKGMKLCPQQREELGEVDGIAQKSTDTDTHLKANAIGSTKADVLVSTPLILLHALTLSTEAIPTALPSVRYLVLDEADVLLDPLFREQTLAIWKVCTNASLQTTLWSATIGSSIESLTQSVIRDRRHNLRLPTSNHHLIRLIVGLKDSALPSISHRLIYVASEKGKLLAIRQLLHPSSSESSATSVTLRPPFLVFTQTISRANALYAELLYDIPPEAGGSSRIAVLHSNLSEKARSKIMAGFRKGEIWILITTDLLSRGIDFRGVNGVVNYDIPNTSAAYIHRAGRTGRAGREGGIAITLYTKEDIPYVKNIANVIAASEKLKERDEQTGSGVQPWLLAALPTVSKKTKRELKKKGVEVRRAARAGENGREARKMRISTKSGFDRRLENRRRGAVLGSRRRMATARTTGESIDEEWGGIDG